MANKEINNHPVVSTQQKTSDSQQNNTVTASSFFDDPKIIKTLEKYTPCKLDLHKIETRNHLPLYTLITSKDPTRDLKVKIQEEKEILNSKIQKASEQHGFLYFINQIITAFKNLIFIAIDILSLSMIPIPESQAKKDLRELKKREKEDLYKLDEIQKNTQSLTSELNQLIQTLNQKFIPTDLILPTLTDKINTSSSKLYDLLEDVKKVKLEYFNNYNEKQNIYTNKSLENGLFKDKDITKWMDNIIQSDKMLVDKHKLTTNKIDAIQQETLDTYAYALSQTNIGTEDQKKDLEQAQARLHLLIKIANSIRGQPLDNPQKQVRSEIKDLGNLILALDKYNQHVDNQRPSSYSKQKIERLKDAPESGKNKQFRWAEQLTKYSEVDKKRIPRGKTVESEETESRSPNNHI